MKSIVIIGASSGIGHECAKFFISKGWKVAVAARREELLKPLKSLSPATVTTFSIDVTREDAGDTLREIIKTQEDVDVIFNVAGIGKQNASLDYQIENATIQTNVAGFTRIIDTSFNYFKQRKNGGHIAMISSIAGTKGLGVAPSYSATKRFQNTYIDALDQLAHIKGYNIRFTDIRPGFVATSFLDNEHRYPMLVSPEKVAAKIVDAIESGTRVKVIDLRYSILTFFWSLIPRWLWVRLPIKN